MKKAHYPVEGWMGILRVFPIFKNIIGYVKGHSLFKTYKKDVS